MAPFTNLSALIQDIASNPGHQRIGRATIAMARGLDIEVGAEGVETLQQYELLQECQCNMLQGHLIARPMQADAVTAMLANQSLVIRV